MIKETNAPEETFAFGKMLGEQAKPGEVICLNGDLGVGKTVFTKGFAEGLGITEPVNSPTFTIVQQYDSGRMPLYHFDVYRIGDISEMDEVGYEDCFYGEGVTLIEWSNMIEEISAGACEDCHHREEPGKGLRLQKDHGGGKIDADF